MGTDDVSRDTIYSFCTTSVPLITTCKEIAISPNVLFGISGIQLAMRIAHDDHKEKKKEQ